MRYTMIHILFFALLVGCCACRHEANRHDVPEVVQSKLTGLYPNAKKAGWKQEDANYNAEFEVADRTRKVLLSPEGEVLRIKEEIEPQHLPIPVLHTLQQNYPNYEIDEAYRVKEKGILTYVVDIEHGRKELRLTFDETGVQIP